MIGIDLSLRSSGLVRLDDDNNLLDFDVVSVCNKKYVQGVNDEEMLIYIADKIVYFVERNNDKEAVAIEGLSFQSASSSKDLVWGNFWFLRVRLRMLYPDMLIGVIPVISWRNPLLSNLTKEERKKLKGNKMKQHCVELLPTDVKELFSDYVMKHDLKEEAIYDLTDAYFLAKFRNSLKGE